MTTVQIMEAARDMLPYTSEFKHDIIRIPVRSTHSFDAESCLPSNALIVPDKSFYEVEFRKLYIKNIAGDWEFVKIY
ncbi:hypothetical protein FC093_08440 [Ilyomonas limi]|uniref:Uncharacterized protein n=1 Tax=Ilyomonas limi TaxID=2575867 RepID=A0A4U3L4S7_9BACT|nr:hypothetical protein [Ilyomonas limi]TKK69334.1 hypothetical protein FC093_08440 [Ilyomonas limi]